MFGMVWYSTVWNVCVRVLAWFIVERMHRTRAGLMVDDLLDFILQRIGQPSFTL